MWGVGPVAQRKLAERGIHTIGELSRTPSSAVERLLGQAVGARLSSLSVNEDPRRVVKSTRARSVGAQSALGRRTATEELVREVLSHLANRVAGRMRARHRAGRTVTVRVRFPGMRAVTRSLTLSGPVAATLTITEIAEQLAWQAIKEEAGPSREITLLAISVSGLVVQHAIQLELPIPPGDPRNPGSERGAARWALDRSVDAVRERFGKAAVGYVPDAMPRTRSVPDEFRELAEREL